MKILNLAAVAFAAAMMLVRPAGAVSTGAVTVPPATGGACSWTLAGAGPLRLQNKTSLPVVYAISDAQPSGAGPFFALEQNASDRFTDIPTATNVYLCNYSANTSVSVIVAQISGSGGASSAAPSIIAPSAGSITTTQVSIGAGATGTVTANTARKYLSVVNTGTGPCRLIFGAGTPSANLGDPLGAAAAAGGQGGTRTFENSYVPSGAVSAFCSAASTLSVMEGQ